jgi:hypothetical protein
MEVCKGMQPVVSFVLLQCLHAGSVRFWLGDHGGAYNVMCAANSAVPSSGLFCKHLALLH